MKNNDCGYRFDIRFYMKNMKKNLYLTSFVSTLWDKNNIDVNNNIITCWESLKSLNKIIHKNALLTSIMIAISREKGKEIEYHVK